MCEASELPVGIETSLFATNSLFMKVGASELPVCQDLKVEAAAASREEGYFSCCWTALSGIRVL